MENNEPSFILSSCSFSFVQDGNTLETTSPEETIKIECEFQDLSDDPFFVLKTDGFSVDDIGDLEKILDIVKKSTKVAQGKTE